MSNDQTVMKIVVGLKLAIVSALVVAAGLGNATAFRPRAGSDCESLLNRNGPLITPRQFFKMASWLKLEALNIDIHTTHLEPLVPLLLSLKRSMSYSEPRHLLRTVESEIDDRIAHRNVTYEYLFYLPFRVGFLLDLQDAMIPGVFESTYPENYLTHAAFSGFLEANRRQKGKMKSMILTSIYDDLRKFPKAKLLLYPGKLSYEDMNQLSARDVWPIGIPMTHVEADGVNYSPLFFAFHDLTHWAIFYESPFPPDKLEIPPKKIKEVEPHLLRAIESQVLRDQDLRVLHFIHFHIFHETTRREFEYRIGDQVMYPSQYSLAGGIKHVVKILKYRIATNSELSLKYIRDDFHKLLTETNETPASVAERNITLYLKLIDQAAAKVEL